MENKINSIETEIKNLTKISLKDSDYIGKGSYA